MLLEVVMSGKQRQTPRKPAMKFAHLRKKLQQQKTPIRPVKKK
jgi:hypothetical protein